MTHPQAILDVLRDVDDPSRRSLICAELESEFQYRKLTADEAEEREDWATRRVIAKLVRFQRANPNATYDETLRHFYTDESISNIAMSDHPFLRMLKKAPRETNSNAFAPVRYSR